MTTVFYSTVLNKLLSLDPQKTRPRWIVVTRYAPRVYNVEEVVVQRMPTRAMHTRIKTVGVRRSWGAWQNSYTVVQEVLCRVHLGYDYKAFTIVRSGEIREKIQTAVFARLKDWSDWVIRSAVRHAWTVHLSERTTWYAADRGSMTCFVSNTSFIHFFERTLNYLCVV